MLDPKTHKNNLDNKQNLSEINEVIKIPFNIEVLISVLKEQSSKEHQDNEISFEEDTSNENAQLLPKEQPKVTAPPSRLSFLNQMAKMAMDIVGNTFTHMPLPSPSNIVHSEDLSWQSFNENQNRFTNS